MFYDKIWGWLRPAIDPWAGQVPYVMPDFDWFATG